MSVRIAVGSSDGIVIDQHFGSGETFYIFELLEDGSFQVLEVRDNGLEDNTYESATCSGREQVLCNESGHGGCGSGSNSGGHDELRLLSKISILKDCDAVLVKQIGRGAEKLLLKNGISAFEAKDSIEKAFSKLFIYYKRTKKL